MNKWQEILTYIANNPNHDAKNAANELGFKGGYEYSWFPFILTRGKLIRKGYLIKKRNQFYLTELGKEYLEL